MQDYKPSMAAVIAKRTSIIIQSKDNDSVEKSQRLSHRMSIWNSAAGDNEELQDDLGRAQKTLREMKMNISAQSKRNFMLERDVRYLDSRIALLIQNRKNRMEMSEAQQHEVNSRLEEIDHSEFMMDSRKQQLYANLFHLLQTEPRHMAGLARIVTLSQIDVLLQTVMFTIYGNQYETREEYLLLSMFQNVLAAEFEGASNFAGLMRANTPVSRMMTTYTRRSPGQTYLKIVLSERVNKVMSLSELDLEINPLKVYDSIVQDITRTNGSCTLPPSISPEEAEKNPDVQALISTRVATLMEIGASFLSMIMSSIDTIPYGIRWICKQIRSLAKRKFPESTEAQKCSLIGGFFMLRFLNPAIVTPSAYMLLEKEPRPFPKRTLVLIAKLLQNLANKPTYTKEPFMSVLNPFVSHNEARFHKFLNDLCEVGDFYEALEMEQYIVLSKKEIELDITLNELYSTHEFLEQHLDTLTPDPQSRLRTCISDLGPAPAQLPRSENRTVKLGLFSRWDDISTDPTQTATETMSDALTRKEFLYYDTKALLVQIFRLMQISGDERVDIQTIIHGACNSREQALVVKGVKVQEMMNELERMGIFGTPKEHLQKQAVLFEEVTQELSHLGSLATSIHKELDSLKIVYKTIQDHNEFLKGQLSSYKSYLQNVRVQAMPVQAIGSTSSLANSKGDLTQKGAKVESLRLTYEKMAAEKIICESTVPAHRQSNIYFSISSPNPGSFIIELYYKGRDQAILELNLTLDDILEKQHTGVMTLDLEYVKLYVPKVLELLTKFQ